MYTFYTLKMLHISSKWSKIKNEQPKKRDKIDIVNAVRFAIYHLPHDSVTTNFLNN